MESGIEKHGWDARLSLLSSIKFEAQRIDNRLQSFLAGEPRGLYSAAYYLPSLGGKRMRPYVTIMCGRMFGEADEQLYLSALSVELLHNFTLVHDDIMDRDDFRRGHPTVHKEFGETVAILAGDLLFSKAFEAASVAEEVSGSKGIVRQLSTASIKVDEGQFLDISFEKRLSVSIEEYLKMIYLKTASLYECSALIGGIVGGVASSSTRSVANENQLFLLAEYGKNLGLAFQIRDDYLGVFGDASKTGKPVGNDLRRGKKTVITIMASESASGAQLARFQSVLGNSTATTGELNEAISLLKDMGIDAKCIASAKEYAERAVKSLSAFPETGVRELLQALAHYASTRES